ncbi:MAG TPA: 23S rRNA (adenine(2030)-N(6))-methyltransferase RlmJ [Gammaproteobacteria bacterium]|nr:23S rRNA (adenine(2030)-N(6))-methyltransferase RlmJ [Gammaproteobacteria bacterium]
MLSYQHAYHAGNHADVLKHVVLLSLLAKLAAKDKPLRYIETHTGAGGYDLRSPAAQKNREYLGGIGKIWKNHDAPEAVTRLIDLVRRHNGADATLERYPGSPLLALEILRPGDRAYLFELHGAEHRALLASLGEDGRVTVLREDGLAGCIGLVPPPERRGLVLVDPSYEVDNEYERVIDTLQKAHRRFATGTFAIWYPVLERRQVHRFERALRGTGIGAIDLYELCVAPDGRGRGLTGSGMIVVNPPWKARDEIAAALPWLARELSLDGGGTQRVVELSAPA